MRSYSSLDYHSPRDQHESTFTVSGSCGGFPERQHRTPLPSIGVKSVGSALQSNTPANQSIKVVRRGIFSCVGGMIETMRLVQMIPDHPPVSGDSFQARHR